MPGYGTVLASAALLSIEDATAKVHGAVKAYRDSPEAIASAKAGMARIENECAPEFKIGFFGVAADNFRHPR